MNPILTLLRRSFPLLDVLAYYRAARRGDLVRPRDLERRFREVVLANTGKRCLQIGVPRQLVGAGWTVVDLLAPSALVDVRNDEQKLRFNDGAFDLVVCTAVLGTVKSPRQTLRELRRVLKPGGEIWVEVPYIQAPDPALEGGGDYWRASLAGVRLWMEEFEELSAGMSGSPLWNGVYFHGRRPPTAAAARPAEAPPDPPQVPPARPPVLGDSWFDVA
jgi:SAM-dependent methyltransferase